MKSASIQICGTGSGVGKSVIVAALCRIFLQDGYKVAPFKAQNMALNSYVTLDGKEMGRAQVTQAQASGIEPTVDMNPILIKPNSDTGAQIIVRGKPIGNMSVAEYTKYKNSGFGIIRQSLRKLLDEYEVVVMEGAGSPAEINLKSHDIVNLKIAEYAKAAVILVGDIDKGGVFAWIVGTLELLSKKERKMIKGIIINKFRGDKTLLMPGIEFLEKRTGIKVLGIVPYYRDINIPEEDAVPLDSFKEKDGKKEHKLNIDVIYLPHISNFTDFDALEREDDVRLRYVKSPQELEIPDMIIIPGTKNTISDLKYLKKCGLAKKIKSIINSNRTTTLVGICGGYQMLGNKIFDKDGLESKHGEEEGLKLLP
ncbi:MAG: cobyric acid synthase, partial [Candidatus Omnitrophota bacterium]